jgi:hypothetical protein
MSDDVTEPVTDGSPSRMRLITSDQYLNTLAYVFGYDIRPDTHFAPLQRTDGLLENGAASAGVTAGQLEQYQRIAAVVAARVVDDEHRDILISCKPASEIAADRACAAMFLAEAGRLLYRHPLSAAKVNEVTENATMAGDQLNDFYAGLGIALEGMLIDAEMLFVADMSEPDRKHPGHQRLDAYSLASRLSYFLWNTAPDDALLKAAAKGDLESDKGRARVVDMMLASPRLVTGMRAFFDDMFGFDDFGILSKDAIIYPFFADATAVDAREQTLRTVVDHLITKRKDYRDLFTTRDTFMSPALAAVYRVPAASSNWTPYEFPPDSPRAGLLTQISFLSLHAHPGRSSPTRRGKALRERLLCQTVPTPPANVDFSLINDPKSTYHTARERLTIHRENPVCAGCHKITDPMGLGLENFDGAGQYRAAEMGTLIDAAGSLDGKEFTDAAGLGQALHDHPALTSCLVKRLYSYGTGGAASSDDQPILRYFDTRFVEEGYRLPDLLRTIALSTAFSAVADSHTPPTRAMKAAAELSPRVVAAK